MRSKFTMWSDQGILSPKTRPTGVAWLRGTIVVCSVCGIAAAGVYSQIGPDRGTAGTDRATGYGTEERLAQEVRAQVSRSTAADAYARSGATTGAASPDLPATLATTAATPQSSTMVARATASEPAPMATPESLAKPARRTTLSESMRAAPESAKTARRMDDQTRQAAASSASAAEDSSDRTPQRRRTGSAADSASRGNTGRDSARSAATKSAPQEPRQPQSEQADAAPANAAAADTDPDGKTAHAPGRFDEKSRGTRRHARNGSRSWTRGDNYAGLEPRDRRDTEFEPQGWRAQQGYMMFEPRYREFQSRDRRRAPPAPPFGFFGMNSWR
jgi:hypothetical protein